MADAERSPAERWSYADYLTWPEGERWELIDGTAWAMSPAPVRRHQEVSRRLERAIDDKLGGRPCRMFHAPFDVLLPRAGEADDEVDTVVQPDIVVFCDKSKLTPAGARGAPDIVVEVLSPSTAKKDQNDKFALYERHGVREYWVVDPAGKWLCVYRLGADGRFDDGELRESLREYGRIESRVLEGFAVLPEELFADLD